MPYLFPDKQNIEEPTTSDVQSQIEGLNDKLKNLEKTVAEQIKEQRSENKNIIHAVLIAAVLIFIGLAIEIIIFHTQYRDVGEKYQTKLEEIETKIEKTKQTQ